MEERVQGECFCMGAGPQVTAVLKSIGPKAAMEHFRKSRLEFLKGMRSLLDARIEKLTRADQPTGASVPVE
ncbi:MAG: hypothetical protein JWO80_2925 [Bryobacterales bacterium]|nr:hypothetical protein [Bryobacterales bacterium]